jgi:hypothetical protein
MGTDDLEIIDSKDVPKLLGFDTEQIKEFLERHKKDRDGLDYSILKTGEFVKFKEFWLLCDSPIPVVFKYKHVFYITRDKTRIKGGEKEMPKEQKEIVMEFVDNTEVPKANRGKVSKDWLSILSKIPVGKTWITESKGISTLRKAIIELEKAKKIKVNEYITVQRTQNGIVKGYVSHNKV